MPRLPRRVVLMLAAATVLVASHSVVVVLPAQHVLDQALSDSTWVQSGDVPAASRENCTKWPACGVVLNPGGHELVLQRHSGDHLGCSINSEYTLFGGRSSWQVWNDTDCIAVPNGRALFFPGGIHEPGEFFRIHSPVLIVRV